MLKQTSDPCPGLASRFPGPHTFPAGRAVAVSPVSSRPAGSERIKGFLFRFHHSDLGAAVPALYNEIGIPALLRGNHLGLCT